MTAIDPKAQADVERAVDVLCDPALAPICEMALFRGEEPGTVEARNARGRIVFRRVTNADDTEFEIVGVEGRDPLRQTDPAAFSPIEAELENLFPGPDVNHYPNALASVAQIFDSPNAPDVAAVHTAAHNWEDQGGHIGEHGSIDVVQARAPMVFSGKGFAQHGMIDASMRNIDLAPTLAAALGIDSPKTAEGKAVESVLDSDTRPDHLVFFLFDGTNSNVLHSMAGRGELPNVARLMDDGTTLRHGSISSFPTVTLANHTSMITGAYPGHHGILHNAYFDRSRGEQVITNSPSTWPIACGWMQPGIETLPEALHRRRSGVFAACVNEPVDRGADYSTFGFFRRGEVPPLPKSAVDLPHAHERFVRPHKEYGWSVTVDHMGVDQATGIWRGSFQDTEYPLPTLMWVNFTLTDSGFHLGGPHSEVARAALEETDARLGDILDSIEAAGVYDNCAFALSADHGMEQTNPEVTGDWAPALRDAGLGFRDEGFGFIYLNVDAGGRQPSNE